MAHQSSTAAHSSGRKTRQHSRSLRAEHTIEANAITSSPETLASTQVDIDKLSKELGSVALQDVDAVPPTAARAPPSTDAELTTAAKSTSKVKDTAAAAKCTNTIQRPHQDPLIVRRSRRGERAISHHPQIGRYRVELTSSERLWCGKFALGISSEQQVGIRLTIEDFDEIFASDECRAFNEKHGWIGVEDTARNFYDEQLDFVLRAWGRRHGLRLQLGVVRDFEGVFVNTAVDETEECKEEGDCTTVWIHNDNAMLLGRPYNHYSGISVLDTAN